MKTHQLLWADQVYQNKLIYLAVLQRALYLKKIQKSENYLKKELTETYISIF